MKYELVVRPEADRDIEESFGWYEEQMPGLGIEFVLAVRNSLGKIVVRPNSFPTVFGITRRIVLNRFPFSVFFTVIEDVVTVTGCIHQKRDSEVWRSRE